MSKDTLSGGCQQRYKGIENFLRRVAFNLGNTPSETEVKIISCIPIDVTDLQQKIADLEKQLEQASASKTSSPDKLSLTIKSSQTKKRASSPPLTKQRSTTSYLEDVISVNPASHNKPASTHKTTKTSSSKRRTKSSFVTNQLLYANSGSFDNSESIAGKDSSVSIRFDCTPGQTRKSIISVLYPTSPSKNCNIVAELSNKSTSEKQEKLKDPKKSFFHKKKSRAYCRKKKNCKTELVYYATPDTKTPFNNVDTANATSKNADREGYDNCNDEEVYFSNMINKQYMPRPVLNDLSNTSEFSSPVCRDNVQCRATSPYESDVCSCCRGPFQNLDQHMSPAHRFDLCPTFTDKENDNKYAYYDSSAYDVIPVKEKNYKSPEGFDVLNRRDYRRHIDIKCWPENVRPKKVQPTVPKFVPKGRRNQRVIVNYHTVAPIRNNLNVKSNKRNTKKDIVLNNMAEKRPIMTHSLKSNRTTQDFNICDVEFGEVYAKQNTRQKLYPKPVMLHNASCSTTILNDSECQTGMETNESLVEDKTAATLNQIKTILQSVLTEVKTKGKLTSPEPKKDAVVQNSPSQSNIIGGSQLLNSFTYSHYNTNPYIASCSRQMPPNNYCPPNVPYSGGKCIQQYPLFVQPNRQLCSTCDKNKHSPTMGSMKPAFTTAAATNTDQIRDRSKETQKLIKEIYNSIALNIEIPTKDTTLNQGDQNKNSKTYVMKTDNDKEIHQRSNLISEIFKNSNPLNTSVTEKMTPVSKLTSNDTTFRSGYNNRAPLPDKQRTVNKDHSVDSTSITGDTEPDRVEAYREADSDDQSNDTPAPVNEDETTDSSSTDDDTEKHVPEAAELGTKKQGRKGILSKMFKLFTPRNRRQPKKSIKEENDNDSDSDDYQTVYSQKVSARPKTEVRKVQEVRKVYHPLPNKVIHSKHQRIKQRSPERFRRTPYMEQEYRRYWDEKLLFQDRYAKQSTEASRMTTPQAMSRPVYYQNYEARSAVVEPNRRMVANIQRTPARKSSYVTNRPRVASKGLAWLKKHKLGIECSGEQWKKLILEG